MRTGCRGEENCIDGTKERVLLKAMTDKEALELLADEACGNRSPSDTDDIMGAYEQLLARLEGRSKPKTENCTVCYRKHKGFPVLYPHEHDHQDQEKS